MIENPLESLYRGLTLPLAKKENGIFTLLGTYEVIRSSLKMILLTIPGERVMLPEFGSRLMELVGEQNDDIAIGLAKRYTADALARWDNRVQVLSVQVTVDEEYLSLRVEYLIKSLAQEDFLEIQLPKKVA